jgi:hypothetical protein
MSNNFYEGTLLREEFRLVANLQQDAEFSKYVSVSYEDRNSRAGEVRSVAVQPSGPRYPEKYVVEYRMPVYVSPGQLRQDWHGTATMILSEPVLTNKHSYHAPHVTFHSNFTPFNNHVLRDSICSGNAWAVARDNGLWHFIISLGALINQDEFVSAEGRHYNGDAYNYWIARGRKPVTDIRWPLALINQPPLDFTRITKAPEPQTQTLTFTKVPDRLEIKLKPAPSAPAPIVFTPKKG